MADNKAPTVCEVCGQDLWEGDREDEPPIACVECERIFGPCCNSLMDFELCVECVS